MMHEAAVDDPARQRKHYVRGVGAEWYDQYIGGAVGLGVDTRIRDGYGFLVDNYADGDSIFIFGFSRGAFEARSLAGMIGRVGLLKPPSFGVVGRDVMIQTAWELYRDAKAFPDRAANFKATHSNSPNITMVGVFDTVGALGIPLIFTEKTVGAPEFHDLDLGEQIDNAYQALSIDEHGGWKPKGFVNLALEMGYKLSFEASSDHISTHMSYSNLLATDTTREAVLDAFKKRHVYGATDHILAEFTSGAHIMGDAFSTSDAAVVPDQADGDGAVREDSHHQGQQVRLCHRARQGDGRFHLARFQSRRRGRRPITTCAASSRTARLSGCRRCGSRIRAGSNSRHTAPLQSRLSLRVVQVSTLSRDCKGAVCPNDLLTS